MRLLLLLLALAACTAVIEAKRRTPPPIKGDDDSRRSRRRHRKSSVCHFGKQTYELEAMWNPDLGSPFGVMYCVQCECVPIQRKRRVVGRVKCRNIKRDCPKPSCKNPVLPPGECCKVCTDDSSRGRSRADLVEEDDEPSGKEFAVLMTGLTSLPPSNTSAVATGRFRLARRELTYTFYYNRTERPDRLVFFDETSSIVEELETSATHYEVRSQKICGVWKKMPRRYRRKLKTGRLYVGFGFGPALDDVAASLDLVISGKILRYRGMQTEKFSALLVPDESAPPSGAGGTAIVSLASQTGGFHLTLVSRGIWGPDDLANGQLVLQMSSRSSNKMTLDEAVDVSSIKDGETIVEAKTSLLRGEMRQLARAHLYVKLFSRQHPERHLSGVIMPKIGCNIFSALLSGVQSSDTPPPKTTASGLATLRLWNDGSLDYAIRLLAVKSTVLRISIETDGRSRGRSRPYEVDDVLPQYLGGWANGTLRRMIAKDVEALLDEHLYINVATEKYKSELRGRVTQLTVSEARQSDAPIMLTSRNSSSAGVAWIAVDNDCALHYKVQVADRTRGNRRIELVEFPGRKRRERILAEFGGSRAENRINNLPKTTMMRIEKGLTIVKVVPLNGNDEMSSGHAKVFVPKTCLPARRGSHIRGYFNDQNEYEENEIQHSFDCEYEEQIYEDGAQWDAVHDTCRVCSCNHGRVVCEKIVCPALDCENQLTHPDTCCPVCAANVTLAEEANESSQGCSFAGRFRPVGTKWHPYLPPNGFDKCIICICEADAAGEGKVRCSRAACPPLDCPGREYMPKDGSCCRACRPPAPPAPRIAASSHRDVADEQFDEGREMTREEIQNAGGCSGGLRRNGDRWHPRIETIGELPCVNCHCRDGQVTCSRQHCPKLTCHPTKKRPGTCCPVCVSDRSHRKGEKARRRRYDRPADK